jgi:hypothetical protein
VTNSSDTVVKSTTEDQVTDQERRLAAASCGVYLEVVPHYDHGRPTATGDLPVLLLTVNFLRTPEARALRVELIETAALAMGLSATQAKDLVMYWQQERVAAAPDSLLSFLGEAAPAHVAARKRESGAVGELARRSAKRRRVLANALDEGRVMKQLELFSSNLKNDLVRERKHELAAMQAAMLQKQDDVLGALRIQFDSLQLTMVQNRDALRLAQERLMAVVGDLAQSLLRAPTAFRISTSLGLRRNLTAQTLSLCQHISLATERATRLVLSGRRGLRRPRARSGGEADKPAAQRATALEAGPRALTLSSAFVELHPTLPYGVWIKIRKDVGAQCLRERLRRHALGPAHPDYVDRPRLWSTHGQINGGGARFLYLREQLSMALAVLREERPTTQRQRLEEGAPPLESLLQRAHRLQAAMSAQDLAAPWPHHVAQAEI